MNNQLRKPPAYKPGYVYATPSQRYKGVYVGDMYVPFDMTLTYCQNGDVLQTYIKRKNQKVHIILPCYGKAQTKPLSNYLAWIKEHTKDTIRQVRGWNPMAWIWNEIECTNPYSWRKTFPKRFELYQMYDIDADFAKETAKLLEETKETIKNSIDDFLVNTSGLLTGPGNVNIFLSDKPRTYDNLTETEKFLLKRTVEKSMKDQYSSPMCRPITHVAIMEQDGVVTAMSGIDNKFFRLLFD